MSAPSVHQAASGCGTATSIKPLVRGLVDRTVVPPAPGLQASVIQVNWSDIEPHAGVFDNSKIDAALSLAGCTTPLKLRVLAGIQAPDWLKTESGGAVSAHEPSTNATGTIGRFWTADFQQRYDELQSELSAAYDTRPNLDEVVVSACTLFYSEPLIRYVSDSSDSVNLPAAGYTEALDKQCQQREIDITVQRWNLTRFSVAFNPYQVYAPGPSPDEAYTEQLMAYCRYVGGQRCVLENDSIRDPISSLVPTAAYASMYDHMAGIDGAVQLTQIGGVNVPVVLGAPLAFQTATAIPDNIGDFWGTLLWARERHAASVELPVDGSCPTICAPGSLSWQNLAVTSSWFLSDPAIPPAAVSGVEGASTAGTPVATLTLDESAAVDTAGGYSDVGSVPFDTVAATLVWPDGAREAALLTTGGAPPASSVTCSATATCVVTIEGGGHAPAEEVMAPVGATVTLAGGGVTYVPANGMPIVQASPATIADAGLSITTFSRHVGLPGHVRLAVVFSDADPAGTLADYSALVTWGDGSSTVGTVLPGVNGLTVKAQHVYSAPGQYNISVSITDSGGATVSASKRVSPYA